MKSNRQKNSLNLTAPKREVSPGVFVDFPSGFTPGCRAQGGGTFCGEARFGLAR